VRRATSRSSRYAEASTRRVRVHSAKTFKPLAVLESHRDSVYIVAFAPTRPDAPSGYGTSDDEDDAGATPKRKRTRAWLAAAGKDMRISLWSLYEPA
jgi:hypothetical protein